MGLTGMGANDWLSGKKASLYLEALGCFVSHKTLANYRCNNNAGRGPSFVRTGWKTVRYLKTDLDAWAKRQMVRVE
jgi:hypothetical protein